MLTGVFRDRARLQRDAAQTAHQALAQLMCSKALTPHRAVRQRAIGPFVVDYVFKAQSLIVELEPRDPATASRAQGRAVFLTGLGYIVLTISRRELQLHPHKVLDRIRAALR